MGPPKAPALARSTSMWIHWKSPVASANWLTRSWVISIQSLYPTCWPTSSRSPAAPSMMRGDIWRASHMLTPAPTPRVRQLRLAFRAHPPATTSPMPDFLTLYAAAQPDKPAVIDDRPDGTVTTLTYAELEDRANRLANVLLALGVKAGESTVVWC